MNTIRLFFTSSWRDPATGRSYEGGDTAEVAAPTARDLILRGKAREADPDPDPEPEPDPDAAPAGPAVADPEPTAPEEPTGSAKTAPARRRSTSKEVAADG